ncbi:MAG: DUF4249 domain-containing protein [Sphingobacteriales bacterium]
MMMRFCVLFLILIQTLTGCKKQINSQVLAKATNYLVVSGNIALGDTTVINLSRMLSVNDTARSKPELNAMVTIEGSQTGSYPLISKNNGNYTLAPLNLSSAQNYRLKIVTSDGRQYASDFVPVKNSPPIDSVNYVVQYNGLQINVNTHDPANNTHYYRWDYTETYIVRSEYNSRYIVVNHDTTALRTPDQQIYNCWATSYSSAIALGSSVNLSSDIIKNQQVALIPPKSEKLRVRYSILVKQYGLTSDAYNYFTLLKKNTEQLGSIFDAEPSELKGNIHSLSNSTEPVIGYVTVSAITQARIFVDNQNLPASWAPDLSYYNGCQIFNEYYDYIPPLGSYDERLVQEFIYTGFEIPIDTILVPKGLKSARPYCVDCTLRGTNKQPAFWK